MQSKKPSRSKGPRIRIPFALPGAGLALVQPCEVPGKYTTIVRGTNNTIGVKTAFADLAHQAEWICQSQIVAARFFHNDAGPQR